MVLVSYIELGFRQSEVCLKGSMKSSPVDVPDANDCCIDLDSLERYDLVCESD